MGAPGRWAARPARFSVYWYYPLDAGLKKLLGGQKPGEVSAPPASQFMQHFSLSQARTALACPQQWRYSRQIVISEGDYGLPALCGQALDKGLASWYSYPSHRATKAENALTASLTALEGTEHEYLIDETVRDFWAILDHPEGLKDARTLKSQVEIIANLPGVPIPVLGYADLVDYTQNCVTDHKRDGGWDQSWWDAAKRQVALYAGALKMEHGKIVQVKDGKVTVLEFEVTAELVEEAHDEIRMAWLWKDGPATPGKACAWCPYLEICPDNCFGGVYRG